MPQAVELGRSRVLVLVASVGCVLVASLAVATPLVAAVTGLVTLGVLPFVWRARRREEFHPLDPLWPFLVGYGVTFAMKPLLDAQGYTTYHWFHFDEHEAATAVLFATVALAVLYGGYFSSLFLVPLRLLPWPAQEPDSARTRAAAAILVLGGLYAGARVIISLGGVEVTAVLAGKYRLGAVNTFYGQGYITLLTALAVFAPAIQTHAALRTRWWVDWVLAGTWLLAVLAVSMVLYSRNLVLQTVLAVLVVLHFKGGWFGKKTILVLGAVALVVGGFLGLRLRSRNADVLASVAFLGHTFDSFEFLVVALRGVPLLGEFSGRSIIEDFFWTYVPRTIFPGKPEVYGIVAVQNLIEPSFSKISVRTATYPPGFLVEWYANFGVPGALCIAFMYGAWLRALREWVFRRRHAVLPLVVYGAIGLNLTGLFRSSAQYFLQATVLTAVLYLLLHVSPRPVRLRGTAVSGGATSPASRTLEGR